MRSVIIAAAIACGMPAGAAVAAGWEFREAKDPITDAARGFATLESESGSITFKCDENGPGSVYVQITPEPPYVGPTGGRTVQIRLDEGEVRDDVWQYGRDHVAKLSVAALQRAFRGAEPTIDTGASVDELAVPFSVARKLVFRVLDYRFAPVDVILTSDGDPAAVKRVYQTCGAAWPSEAP